MGYQTRFDFTNNSQEIINAIGIESKYWTEEDGDCQGEMTAKCYSWRDDMKEVSLKFPDTILYVEGEGEENDDIWEARFLNGKSEIKKAQIVIPPFTEII